MSAKLLQLATRVGALALLLVAGATSAEPHESDALLDRANKSYEHRQFHEAVKLWQEVDQKWPNTPAWGKAVFNLGLDLKRRQRFDDAMVQFRRVVEGNVNDLEPGGNIMEPYRNYRPRAQWEIGLCLLAKGRYADALEAFQTVRTKFPFQSWCGNETAAFATGYLLYEGVCFEHLGRHAEAAPNYYRVASSSARRLEACVRLVELYAAAGQLADLRKALDAADAEHERAMAPYIAELQRELREKGDRPHNPIQGIIDRMRANSGTRPIRELLAMRDEESRGDFAALAARVRMGGSSGGAVQRYNRDGNFLAVEAARTLARHPAQALPELQRRLGADGGKHDDWIWYAIGVCGGPDAVEFLIRERARDRRAGNTWYSASLNHAIGLARGEPDESEQGRLSFPPLPKTLQLPPDPRPRQQPGDGATGG